MQENSANISEVQKPPVMKQFPAAVKDNLPVILISLAVVFLGVLTGWFLAGGKYFGSGTASDGTKTTGLNGSVTEAGAKDESKFKESAEGTLREGGIKGEGTHYLERPGGPSQNAYMVSTSLDLSPFVGKKVKVWGETISAVNAGWLLDVGKIRVIE